MSYLDDDLLKSIQSDMADDKSRFKMDELSRSHKAMDSMRTAVQEDRDHALVDTGYVAKKKSQKSSIDDDDDGRAAEAEAEAGKEEDAASSELRRIADDDRGGGGGGESKEEAEEKSKVDKSSYYYFKSTTDPKLKEKYKPKSIGTSLDFQMDAPLEVDLTLLCFALHDLVETN